LGVVVLVVAAGLWWWFSGATMRKYEGALANGKLVGTDGASALELYSVELHGRGPTSTRVQKMREQARPVVRKRLDDLFGRWYQDSDLGEGTRWSDVQKLAAWSGEMEPADNDVQARAKFAHGQTELLANHFVEAEQLFRAALGHKPDWALVLNGIGRACRNQRNYQCAEEYYRRAAQADPNWIFPRQNLAGLFLEQNRLAESESEYQAAVRLNPNRSGSRFLLGQLYDRKRSFPEACAEYRAALSLAANQTRTSFDREWVNRRIQRICK
jgi:tetratricopeptide (TPR) repeat protein